MGAAPCGACPYKPPALEGVMATTLEQSETPPAAYPDAPAGLSADAAAIAPAAVWARIEAWVSQRWVARNVVWIVEGPGEWVPPLSPVSSATVEIWQAGWTPATPDASPRGGYEFAAEGPYRITATVGGGDVPEPVSEAYRRLAEYWADASGAPAGASTFRESVPGLSEMEFSRSASWLARAIHNSGAADLLRPYRGSL